MGRIFQAEKEQEGIDMETGARKGKPLDIAGTQSTILGIYWEMRLANQAKVANNCSVRRAMPLPVKGDKVES